MKRDYFVGTIGPAHPDYRKKRVQPSKPDHTEVMRAVLAIHGEVDDPCNTYGALFPCKTRRLILEAGVSDE